MLRYRAHILASLLATAALAVPATASATTFCVNARNCPAGGVQAGADLQGALDAADAGSGDDTVLVGDKGSPYVGPFTYEGATNRGVTNPVTITADAGGRPVLTAGVGLTVLTLDQATVEGVDVEMPSAAEGTGVLTTDATLRDVTVSSPQNGPGATGIQDLGATVLDHVRVTVSGDVGLQVGAPGKVSIRRVSVSAQNLDISNADGAVVVDQAGALSATQSQLTGTTTGLFAAASTDLDRVVVATSAPSSTGISANDANLRLTHVTVAHEGPESGTDTALSLHAAAANPSLTVADSTLAGYTHGIERTVSAAHTLAITAENNVWNPAGDQLGGASAGPVRELGDVHVEPALVKLAAGDLRPRGSSPQIDLDTNTDATTYTDLVGTPTVDGNGDGTAQPDAGALEYRRQAPTIDAIAIPTAGTAGTPVAFDTSVSDADGDQVQVRWDFGDGANAAGPASSHTYAAPGSFQGTLTATDEAGLTARRTFTVNVTPCRADGEHPWRADREYSWRADRHPSWRPPAGASGQARAGQAASEPEQDLGEASGESTATFPRQRDGDDPDRPEPADRAARGPAPRACAPCGRRKRLDRACECAANAQASEARPADADDHRERRPRRPHPTPNAPADAGALTHPESGRGCARCEECRALACARDAPQRCQQSVQRHDQHPGFAPSRTSAVDVSAAMWPFGVREPHAGRRERDPGGRDRHAVDVSASLPGQRVPQRPAPGREQVQRALHLLLGTRAHAAPPRQVRPVARVDAQRNPHRQ